MLKYKVTYYILLSLLYSYYPDEKTGAKGSLRFFSLPLGIRHSSHYMYMPVPALEPISSVLLNEYITHKIIAVDYCD